MADNLGVKPFIPSNRDPITEAKLHVLGYIFDDNRQIPPDVIFSTNDIFVVWFAKTLQNWKALVGTSIADGKYYEVTYDGEKRATYIDIYQKVDHFEVLDPPLKEP